WCPSLPTGIRLAEDWREIGPGVWCPLHVTHLAHQKWDISDLSVGQIVINHRTDYTLHKVNLDPKAPPERFAGPVVPQGTQVQVADEAGRLIGRYKQLETGELA